MPTTFLRLIALCGLLLGALTFGTAASAAGGNSANAKLCQKGGYVNYARADDTPFANEDQCVSYAAQGGTFIPPQPDLKLNTHCVTDATIHALACVFTATNVGAAPATGSSILLQAAMWSTAGNLAAAGITGTCTFVDDPNNQPTFTIPPSATSSARVSESCADSLGPGQQFAITVSIAIGTVAPGSPINVTAAVDPNNRIAEFNESNNTYNAVVSAP